MTESNTSESAVTLFRNLKISTRLSILFGVLLIAFLAIGVTYFSVLQVQNKANARTDELLEYGGLVSDVETQFSRVRSHEKDFVLRPNDASIAAHASAMKKLQDTLAEVADRAPDNYTVRLVTQAREVLQNYNETFLDVVKARKEVGYSDSDKLRGEARAAAEAAEARIADIGNFSLYQSILTMRAMEDEIISTVDRTAAVEAFKDEHAYLLDLLRQNALIPPETVAYIASRTNVYADKVKAITSGLRRADSYTELYDFLLGPIFSELRESTQTLLASNQLGQKKRLGNITGAFTLFLAAIALVLLIGLVLFSRSLTNPLNRLQETVSKVRAGNLSARSRINSRNELGQLSEAFDTLLDERVMAQEAAEQENERLNDSIIDLIRTVSTLAQQKDLSIKVPVSEDVTGAVSDSLNLLSGEMSKVLTGVRRISQQVSTTSAAVKGQSDLVRTVAAAENQEVQKTAASLRESVVAMNRIAKEAKAANLKASQTIDTTEHAVETVGESVQGINAIRDTISETEKRIKRLGERSQEITGIVNLISSISERTHILALNASMHAASAGEAGRGFAVVADEVQRLAENARDATQQISTLVNNIRVETADTVTTMNAAISQVAEGTRLAEQAGNSMKQTQESTAALVQSVQQITQSSMSQVDVSYRLLEQTREILKSTEKTDEQLTEQSASTDQLVQYAQDLVDAVAVFKLPGDDESDAGDSRNEDAESEKHQQQSIANALV